MRKKEEGKGKKERIWMTMDAVKREDGVSGWKALYTFIRRGGAEPSVSIRGNFQDAARDYSRVTR